MDNRLETRGLRSLMAMASLAAIAVVSGLALRAIEPQKADLPNLEALPVATLASLPVSRDAFDLGPALTRVDTKLRRGETLSGLMDRMDVTRLEGAKALNSLIEPGYLDARRVLPGLPISLHMEDGNLAAVSLQPEPGRRLLTKRETGGEFIGVEMASRLISAPERIKGVIETSLYDQARALGAGDQQVVDFAQVFAYDVDFQREVHPGDEFELVFDVQKDERGEIIKRGAVLYAALNGTAVDKGFYRFTTPDENVTDYFQANGESATKFLMKTPINGARLSSPFGKRRHPISGYTRLHKGTDFAAPTGTPVYAAGHGTIERASRYGGYGNYVRIKHANGYKTAYAHLSRYGPGVRSGKRVRQGDIIGYVGSTGASTGPHLHYEVYVKGVPVNAMRLKLPTGRKLAMDPDVFESFAVQRDRIDALREGVQLSAEPALIAASIPPAP
ncbi:MAG: hypothetical protein Hens3KO_15920 [Henriciella sp.]